MNCTNCGQVYPDGATVCPHCGAPISQAAPPVLYPAPIVQPAAGSSVPRASGVATASTVLGLLSIVLSVSTYLALVFLMAPYVDAGAVPSAEEFQSLIGTTTALALVALLVLGQLLAMIGLILGIVGLSQEGRHPTRSGKPLSVIGIVTSCLPLLCCVTLFLLAWSGAAAGA